MCCFNIISGDPTGGPLTIAQNMDQYYTSRDTYAVHYTLGPKQAASYPYKKEIYQ